jgi:glycosyltransferase involved in cell wall biosynthesis
VIFTGRVPFEEVRKYYSVFDICPFPRNDVEVCRYVPPLKVLEAMAMEKAVIVSDLAPLREMVQEGETGLVCKADSVEDLKMKISLFHHNKNLRQIYGKAAREWVCSYRSSEKLVERYEQMYHTFLKDQ